MSYCNAPFIFISLVAGGTLAGNNQYKVSVKDSFLTQEVLASTIKPCTVPCTINCNPEADALLKLMNENEANCIMYGSE